MYRPVAPLSRSWVLRDYRRWIVSGRAVRTVRSEIDRDLPNFSGENRPLRRGRSRSHLQKQGEATTAQHMQGVKPWSSLAFVSARFSHLGAARNAWTLPPIVP